MAEYDSREIAALIAKECKKKASPIIIQKFRNFFIAVMGLCSRGKMPVFAMNTPAYGRTALYSLKCSTISINMEISLTFLQTSAKFQLLKIKK